MLDHTTALSSIEATLLGANVSKEAIESLASRVVKYGFHGVCVAPSRVKLAASLLLGTRGVVVSVAGFPLGNTLSETKAREVGDILDKGASEVDMVINVGAFLDGDEKLVAREIAEARRVAGEATLKIILETGYLTCEEIMRAGAIAVGEGADFLKTSTGFGPRGATIEDVKALSAIPGVKGVKASGGIRDAEKMLSLLAAGASRIGTSSDEKIAKELSALNLSSG
ncbi:MAG: deoxyribose-phosphate aldolase [Deltaproteobacteria bacterium]|nr:MAG: deoxyribose-phosphate aldolase [Deltaproteobacteria bacterium]